MSLTVRIQTICEALTGMSGGADSVDSIITASVPLIFNFDFPIFQESYKQPLCEKILLNYYMREICAETYGQWKLYLMREMRNIMPLYNQYYESALLKFDPFNDTDITRLHILDKKVDENSNMTNDVVTNTNSTVSDVNWNLLNTTPQGGITGIETGKYLTQATKNTDNNNTVSNGKSHGDTNQNTNTQSTDNFIETVQGKTGSSSYSTLLQELRETFINVDMMVIDSLSDLFMILWE